MSAGRAAALRLGLPPAHTRPCPSAPPPLQAQFTEMVLRLLDTGAEAIEEVDGIDAIEAVQVLSFFYLFFFQETTCCSS